MKDILKTIFDRVFSFNAFVLLVVAVFGYAMTMAVLNERENQALETATIKACYNGGLIKVETDGGAYCVAPTNLVKVK